MKMGKGKRQDEGGIMAIPSWTLSKLSVSPNILGDGKILRINLRNSFEKISLEFKDILGERRSMSYSFWK